MLCCNTKLWWLFWKDLSQKQLLDHIIANHVMPDFSSSKKAKFLQQIGTICLKKRKRYLVLYYCFFLGVFFVFICRCVCDFCGLLFSLSYVWFLCLTFFFWFVFGLGSLPRRWGFWSNIFQMMNCRVERLFLDSCTLTRLWKFFVLSFDITADNKNMYLYSFC